MVEVAPERLAEVLSQCRDALQRVVDVTVGLEGVCARADSDLMVESILVESLAAYQSQRTCEALEALWSIGVPVLPHGGLKR